MPLKNMMELSQESQRIPPGKRYLILEEVALLFNHFNALIILWDILHDMIDIIDACIV
jgi:hypothetical protein